MDSTGGYQLASSLGGTAFFFALWVASYLPKLDYPALLAEVESYGAMEEAEAQRSPLKYRRQLSRTPDGFKAKNEPFAGSPLGLESAVWP